MVRHKGFYAIIQYSPKPERFEYLNIGVLLVVPSEHFISAMFADNLNRVAKLFGHQNKAHFDALKEQIENRIKLELKNSNFDVNSFSVFASKRANNYRIRELLPISVQNSQNALVELFEDLVGNPQEKPRKQQASIIFKQKLEDARVFKYLDKKPKPVELPNLGLELKVPFGYQNGKYNFISPISLKQDSREDAVKSMAAKAIEGKQLAYNYPDKKLIVVGDIERKNDGFIDFINSTMKENSVQFFSMDQLNPLISDIKENHIKHSVKAE